MLASGNIFSQTKTNNMKKIYSFSCRLLCDISHAQVTGTKTIGTDYATIAAAVTALNTSGVGVGGATINIPAAYTETAPSGGIVLEAPFLTLRFLLRTSLVCKTGAGVKSAAYCANRRHGNYQRRDLQDCRR